MKKLVVVLAMILGLVHICFAADKIRIGLEYEVQTDKGLFRDTLWWYSQKDFDEAMKDTAKIEAVKQARVNNWLAIVSQKTPEPTLEDYRHELADREEEVARLKDIIKEKEDLERPTE